MKVFIGICNSQDSIPSNFFWSFEAIRKNFTYMAFRSMHPWDVVRNNLIISEFLKSDCELLAKMDVDQQYPPDYFERLIPVAQEHGVAGPMIYDRWEQNGFMPLAFDQVNINFFPCHKMDLTGLSGVVEVPFPHTNLVYRKDVLQKARSPWYEAYLSPNGLSRLNHVDYLFIDKIHKAGFKVMIDLDCEVKHKTTKYIGKADAESTRNKIVL